jgi:sensor histidine kinase YesM
MNATRLLAHPRVTTFLITTTLCFGIAWLLAAINFSDAFGSNLVISMCIGYSIYFTSVLAEPWLRRRLPPFFGEAIAVAAGLAIGLALGGTVISGRPGFFYTEQTGTVMLGIFFGVIGTVLFASLQRVREMRGRLEHAELLRLEQEKSILETELRVLQAQIEPHFLFNTLSNVIGLIARDPDAARRTLEHLTTLLRATLDRTRAARTTLGEELLLVRAYLEIQRLRMGDRLRFRINGLDDFRQTPLPPLLLQPLVENAVKHGIDPAEHGGTISLSATATDATLTLTVADDGVGPGDGGARPGTGLANVRDRLRSLYGERARLTIRENTPHGMIATIELPRAVAT